MFKEAAARPESGGVQPCQRETRALHCETTQGRQTPPGRAGRLYVYFDILHCRLQLAGALAVVLPGCIDPSSIKTKGCNWTATFLAAVEICKLSANLLFIYFLLFLFL